MPLELPSISLLAPHERLELPSTKEAVAPGEGADVFDELLKSMAVSANDRIHEAEAAGEAFAAGQRDDIHGTMLSLSKADIELRMVGSVRNRVIDAFYELWRMQI